MISIKRKLSFQIRNIGNLRIRLRWNGYETFLSVGYYVDKNKWNGEWCARNSTHGKNKVPGSVINRNIEIILSKIDDTFSFFELQDVIPDVKAFRQKLGGKTDRSSVSIMAAWISYRTEGTQQRQWADNTLKSIKQVQNLFFECFPDVTFADINVDLLNEFVVKQQRMKLSKAKFRNGEKGYANNVISKNCSILKRFLKWCSNKGYVDGAVLNGWNYNVKSIERPVIFLTWDELMRVNNLDLKDNRMLDEIRDVFCFMCFTSLRYSDAIGLRKSDVYEDYIDITAKKTSVNIRIELNKYSRAILNKYKMKKGIRALPYYSCCNMNFHLKTIAKLANVNDPVTITQYYGDKRVVTTLPKHDYISTHCGRRTFVCNALAMGIPTHVVMKWTGHKNIVAMKPYLGVADAIKSQEMSKFDRK